MVSAILQTAILVVLGYGAFEYFKKRVAAEPRKKGLARFIVADLAWKLSLALAALMMAIFAASLSGAREGTASAGFTALCNWLIMLLLVPFSMAVGAYFFASIRRNEWPYGVLEESANRNNDAAIQDAHSAWMRRSDNEVPILANSMFFASSLLAVLYVALGLLLFGQYAPDARTVVGNARLEQPIRSPETIASGQRVSVAVNFDREVRESCACEPEAPPAPPVRNDPTWEKSTKIAPRPERG
jgi:hypothetical protein